MMKKVLTFLNFFLSARLFCSVTALAYIDPSAMTYIIHLAAGIAIAAGGGGLGLCRLPAEERQRAEELKRALRICTAPRR